MKRLLATVLLILATTLALIGCQPNTPKEPDVLKRIQQRGKLIVGVKYDSKPFGYLDVDGHMKGFDIDLARAIAKALLGKPDAVVFQPVLAATRVMALNAGTVDMVIATMTITPERAKVIDFSRPYYVAGQAVAVSRQAGWHRVADLAGKRLLFVLGTTSEHTIAKRLPNAKLIGFKTPTDAFSALKAGRGDALTNDDTILAGFLQESCGYTLLPERLSREPYGVGFRKHSETSVTAPLRQRVDTLIEQLEQDGTLEALRVKWVHRFVAGQNCPN